MHVFFFKSKVLSQLTKNWRLHRYQQGYQSRQDLEKDLQKKSQNVLEVQNTVAGNLDPLKKVQKVANLENA